MRFQFTLKIRLATSPPFISSLSTSQGDHFACEIKVRSETDAYARWRARGGHIFM